MSRNACYLVFAMICNSATSSAPAQSAENKQEVFHGIARLPDGTPASGAQMVIGTGSMLMSIGDGYAMRMSQTNEGQTVGEQWTTSIPSSGEFTVPRSKEPVALVFLHDRGYAEVPPGELERSTEIQLQAWSRVEGTARIGSQPVKNENVSYSHTWSKPAKRNATLPGSGFPGLEGLELSYHITATTDDEGHFVFDRIPPGKGRLGRQQRTGIGFTETSTTSLDAQSGQIHQLIIGGTGRPVIGRFIASSAPAEETNWSHGHFSLGSSYRQRASTRPGNDASDRVHFPVVPDAEGRFRVEDVPAGNYEVTGSIQGKAPWGQRARLGRSLGSFNKQFLVPEMPAGRSDEPLDVGDINLKLSNTEYEPNPRPTVSRPARRAESQPADSIVLRIIDPDGKPVDQAHVGRSAQPPREGLGFYWTFFDLDKWSDSDGIIEMPAGSVVRHQRPEALYALHEPRQLVGLIELSPGDVGKTLEWKLEPTCRVHGKLSNPMLQKLGRPLSWTNVYVFWKNHRPLEYSSTKAEFEFLLPPGEFKFNAYGTGSSSVNPMIEIKPGQRDLELNLDLPANRLALLEGQIAPELREIKGWRNGPPATLAELRGKVVLIDFWGWWCGPCVALMPELITLQRTYADRGLVVIAIHDDSLNTIENLDQKLTELQKKVSSGEPLPFRVALAGGGSTRIVDSEHSTKGAICADYGVTAWPTTVLIDRQGKVVGSDHSRRIIEKLLAAPAPQTSQPAR